MSAPRIEEVRLEYGRHSGRFVISEGDRPTVIAGRNGTGKTTLLEALLRGLYGFSRRRPEERRLLELRRPWSGRPAAIEVRMRSVTGTRITVHRDLASDEVIVTNRESGEEIFRGDGNPAGVRSESRRYQELLREWIGFGNLEPYRGTAWIAQGELVDTRLDDELLRAAAGTHQKVEVALGTLRGAFEDLTRESLELGGRRKNRPRVLENLRTEEEAIRIRLDTARKARDRRQPLLDRLKALRVDGGEVSAEIELLEAAYRPITERRSLTAEETRAEERLGLLSESLRRVAEAKSELARSEAEATAAEARGSYPADFETRVGRAAALWDRAEELERKAPDPCPTADLAQPPPRALGVAAAGIAAGGAVTALLSSTSVGALLGMIGLVALSAYAVQRRRATAGAARQAQRRQWEESLDSVRSSLTSLSAGLPAPPLSPKTLESHRRDFERQEDARSSLRRARDRWADAVADAALSLGRPETDLTDPGRELDAAREETRTELARLQLQLREQPTAPPLPPGVEATVPALESAREERRARREDLREEETRLDLELRDLDRASEDVFALETERDVLTEAIREAEDEVVVRRAAWELVRDAYEEFRASDQDRLIACVNRRLDRISKGNLGPVKADGDLETARIELRGREVDLDSPPLSFGEKHAALLATRLGAADFLAGEGIGHPLLIDEPFTHLDEVRSREVWDLLCELAKERQVIVTTQDRLVLDHLGIAPDLELSDADRPVPTDMIQDPSAPPTKPTPGRAPAAPPAESSQAQLELG
ncbi:MAG: AAA family ATPase [marine benthic group bacterium]|nr:AAA family ATPase [Candidatus Benthicola marisminoris]